MSRPPDEQILILLERLQKGDYLALRWDAPPGSSPDRCCVIYLRVSSKRQLDGEGLGDQWRACVHFANREGLAIVGLYVDPAISGRKEHRPAIDQLKRDAAGRRFRTVLFFKVNRVGRNARASYETAEEIERHGLAVVSATEPFRRGTAAGNLTFGMLVTVAQFGSDQLSEVMKTRLQYKAQQGQWVGPTPLGTRVVGGVLTADKDIGVVETLWRRYAAGAEGFMACADALNAAGYRTQDGTFFSRESVRSLLKNRAYCGYVSAGGHEHKGKHDELFPDATYLWERNQALMAERTGGTTRNPTSPDAWLNGHVWCEHCRRNEQSSKLWHRSSSTSGGRQNRYYRCRGFDARTHQDAPMIPASSLESQVQTLLKTLELPEELLPQILARARDMVAERTGLARPTITPEKIQQQIERLGEAYADGALTRERYQKRLGELRAMLAEAGNAAAPQSFDERRALDLLKHVPALVETAKPEHLRQLVGAIFSRVWVEEQTVVAVTPRAEVHPLLVARSILKGWSSDQPQSVHGVPDGFQVLHLKPGLVPSLLWTPSRLAA